MLLEMHTYDYIFNSDRLAQMMKAGRAQKDRDWTQSDLATHLSSSYSGCGPEVQLSSIKRIEGARRGDKTGVGILSAIKIAKALELPLPKARIDVRILDFALDLVRNLDRASESCDALFAKVLRDGSNWSKGASWNPISNGIPLGTLNLLPSFFYSSGPIRLSIRSWAWLDAFTTPKLIDQSGVLPVDIIPVLERLGENIYKNAKRGNSSVDKNRPSGFWRHVPSGKSENIGVDRLADEISRYEKGIKQCDPIDSVLQIELRHLIVAAFSNLFDLVLEVKECAGDAGIPEDLIGYVNGYTLLLRHTDEPYAQP